MFWSDQDSPQLYEGLVAGVPRTDVRLAIWLLRAGGPGVAYLGFARCRICGEILGTKDFGLLGFVWPERAEHYIERHGVWVPGLNDLIATVRSRRVQAPMSLSDGF